MSNPIRLWNTTTINIKYAEPKPTRFGYGLRFVCVVTPGERLRLDKEPIHVIWTSCYAQVRAHKHTQAVQRPLNLVNGVGLQTGNTCFVLVFYTNGKRSEAVFRNSKAPVHLRAQWINCVSWRLIIKTSLLMGKLFAITLNTRLALVYRIQTTTLSNVCVYKISNLIYYSTKFSSTKKCMIYLLNILYFKLFDNFLRA